MLSTAGHLQQAEDACGSALTIKRKLLAKLPMRPDLRHELAQTLNNLGIVLRKAKRPREAEAALTEELGLRKKLVADFPNQSDFQQGLAENYYTLGNLLEITGRPEKAEEAHREALAIAKRLWKVGLSPSPNLRHGLALCLFDIARKEYVQKRPNQAYADIREALAIQQQLVAEFPRGAGHRSRLADTHTLLANMLQNSGRLKEAGAAYLDALAVRKQLVADFPFQLDLPPQLEVVLQHVSTLANTYLSRGNALVAKDLKKAEEAYRDALALLKKLVAEFPSRPEFRRDLAHTHHNLGSVHHISKRPKEAEAAMRVALAIRKQLAEDFSKRPEFRRDLASGHFNLGTVFYQAGKRKEAETAYGDALPLQKRLVAESPKVPEYQHDLGATLTVLGTLNNQRRDFAAAAQLFDQARTHLQAALKAKPKSPEYRHAYGKILFFQANNHLARADHARLATNAEELASFACYPPTDAYNGACFLCHSVMLVDKDAKLDQAKRRELAKHYADRALALLRQAVVRGYKNAAHMKMNRDLQPLRERPEFKKLLAELEGAKKK
jgi:tetratricopeptide (TPR) repeat protein